MDNFINCFENRLYERDLEINFNGFPYYHSENRNKKNYNHPTMTTATFFGRFREEHDFSPPFINPVWDQIAVHAVFKDRMLFEYKEGSFWALYKPVYQRREEKILWNRNALRIHLCWLIEVFLGKNVWLTSQLDERNFCKWIETGLPDANKTTKKINVCYTIKERWVPSGRK